MAKLPIKERIAEATEKIETKAAEVVEDIPIEVPEVEALVEKAAAPEEEEKEEEGLLGKLIPDFIEDAVEDVVEAVKEKIVERVVQGVVQKIPGKRHFGKVADPTFGGTRRHL